ncbi:MAG: hypothetical protein CRN43_07200 [Candidatus Nephrothrix sp. EaCA]|nr:MAG: hypothetical protein CRN43_07200 [Candidatus Nephrothrix sp. EaCA]
MPCFAGILQVSEKKEFPLRRELFGKPREDLKYPMDLFSARNSIYSPHEKAFRKEISDRNIWASVLRPFRQGKKCSV